MSYERPSGDKVDFNLDTQGYELKPPDALDFSFLDVQPSVGEVFPGGFDGQIFGTPSARNLSESVAPAGFTQLAFGVAHLFLMRKYIGAQGISSSVQLGSARIWNLRQYILSDGLESQRFGVAYVIGGVKQVLPDGLESPGIGTLRVVNTRADLHVQPEGIAAVALPRPGVSPQILRVAGVLGTVVNAPVVQFPPRPKGWIASAFGYPVIEYKTRAASPAGIDAFAPGYPRVRDRAQRLWPTAVPVSVVFGDVAARLKTLRVSVPGLYAHEGNPWAVVRNTRRSIEAKGIGAASVGMAAAMNRWPALAPKGLDAAILGAHDVGGRRKQIHPKGVPAPLGAMPSPVLWQPPSIAPQGIAAPLLPAPIVWPRRRAFDIGGFTSQRLGQPTIDFRWRKVVLQGLGPVGDRYGMPRVEHAIRGIAPVSWADEAHGYAWASLRRRRVEPVSIDLVEMSRHRVGGTQHLGPVGFEATRWLTRIVAPSQEIFPKTFGAAYGWPDVGLYRRTLRPQSVLTEVEPKDRWGQARAWNLRQFIQMEPDHQGQLAPPQWAGWMQVENRNKTIGAIGRVAALYGRPIVSNRARLLAPGGIAAPALPSYQKTGAVTHRVRLVALDGLEPPAMARWAIVWNKAAVIRPAGFVATLWGGAQRLVNTRRYRAIEGSDFSAPGAPFVAFRIRRLAVESRYSIAPLPIALPRVFLHTRYLEPRGLDGALRGQSKLGLPIVVTHFNTITTRWSHRELAGRPEVRNLTPEIGTRGASASEWGAAMVRLQWRPVRAQGATMALFGQARIADRRQAIAPPGFVAMAIGDKLLARKYGADPATAQHIDLRMFVLSSGGQSEAPQGYGIGHPWPQGGMPDLLKGYIHLDAPEQWGIKPPPVGVPTVTANTIRVEPGYWDLLVGEPVVSAKIRKLMPEAIGPLVRPGERPQDMGSWGLPRLTPHTLYAVVEASEQAMRNHGFDPSMLRPINTGAQLGAPRVSQQRGNVLHPLWADAGGQGMYFGLPRVYNLLQQVTLRGWSSQRIGLVQLPHATVVLQDEPVAGAAFGVAEVARPPYLGPQWLQPLGFVAGTPGNTAASLFHRSIRPVGLSSLAMGDSLFPATFNMPDKLHVGFPHQHPMPGFAATRYGEPWLSHRVRELQAHGWESFLCEYDYQDFKHRMQVRQPAAGAPQWRVIRPQGWMGAHAGTPDVRPGARFIRPDGCSDQFRKGVHL